LPICFRCRAHDLEACEASIVERTLEVDERLRIEAVRGEAAVLAFGVRRAEAGEVHADEAIDAAAHAARDRRVEGGGEELDVAFFEHRASVGGARRRTARDLF